MIKKILWTWEFFLVIILGSFAITCSGFFKAEEKSDPSLLNLEGIFSSREFSPERFGPAGRLKTRNGYTTLEPSASKDKGKDIVRYNPETGQREILVPSKPLSRNTRGRKHHTPPLRTADKIFKGKSSTRICALIIGVKLLQCYDPFVPA